MLDFCGVLKTVEWSWTGTAMTTSVLSWPLSNPSPCQWRHGKLEPDQEWTPPCHTDKPHTSKPLMGPPVQAEAQSLRCGLRWEDGWMSRPLFLTEPLGLRLRSLARCVFRSSKGFCVQRKHSAVSETASWMTPQNLQVQVKAAWNRLVWILRRLSSFLNQLVTVVFSKQTGERSTSVWT